MLSSLPRREPFVGRRSELALLQEEFTAASEGTPRFVSIEGEAGIGKSRLVKEFLVSLGSRAPVRRTECSEFVRAPYLPVAALVPGLDVSVERAALFEAAARFFEREGRRPGVVVFEDLQWADSATVDLLRYLVAKPSAGKLLFLLTMRIDEPLGDAALSAFRSAAARRRVATIRLRALGRNDVRYLVQEVMHAAGVRADPETVSRIEQLSEGNPLFAEELALVALERGTLELSAHVPLSVQAILSQRLASFAQDERELLVRASISGQRFDARFVARIAERPIETVLAVVQRAVDAGLVLPSSDNLMEFSFRHALIRQALAEQLILALAAPLHVRIARELEALEDADGRCVELAYHWSEARVAERAMHYNERAAEASWKLYAYRDAIRYYSMALRWQYPPGAQRARVYERLGTLLYIEGFGEEPARYFERCRAEHEARGDRDGTAHALLRLADQHWVDARTSDSVEAAAQASSMLDPGTFPRRCADAHLSLARFSITLGDPARADRHIAVAASLRESFDAELHASFHEVRAEVRAAYGDARGALADCREASRLAQNDGSSELIAQIENNFALVACDVGEIVLAIERHAIALAEARRTSMMWRVAYSALNYARTLSLAGEREPARQLVWEAVESGVSTATLKTKAAAVGIPIALALNDRRLLQACADEDALLFAKRSGEIQRIGSVAAAFAELRFAQGAPGEARSILRQALSSITHAHRCWELFEQIALHGDASDAQRARELLGRSRGRPRVLRAQRLAFEALRARVEDSAAANRVLHAADTAFSLLGMRSRISPLPCPKSAPSELSARQRQIAELVAKGDTNRGIAEHLHISEHTVEHHLSAIYARLGIRSRSALAARIAAQ